MKKIVFLIILCVLCSYLVAFRYDGEKKIYWGNEVPDGWNGNWPSEFLTVPEKTNYKKTTSSYQIHEFINTLKWRSENMHVEKMFISDQKKVCPVVVMANPRINSPKEAKASGKPVIYLQGNIHPVEPEGKEALLMLMRDVLLGDKKYLLDNQIVVCCPNFNVDGNDIWSGENWNAIGGSPRLMGIGSNALGYNLNRDAIKLESTDVKGLYTNVFNRWDPTIIFDTHTMGVVNHGYAIAYATSILPTAHPSPRGYVTHKVFPAVRQAAKEKWGLEIFTHAGFDPGGWHGGFDQRNWPPKVWSHAGGAWTIEGKFIVSAYGLRNRMSIIVETPAQPKFEKRIYSTYAYAHELLEYTNVHGKEMMHICQEADEDIVNKILTQAESGELKNYVDGKYESWGKIDVLAYPPGKSRYIPGTSILQRGTNILEGPPIVFHDVEHMTKTVGTKEATFPRGYLIPADLGHIVEKLRLHNIKVNVLDKPIKVTGEEFVIDKLVRIRKRGYNMTELEGGFFKSKGKEFPAGTFKIDLAQPFANIAFYCLEPEVGDGFVGWNLFNDYLTSLGVEKNSVVYPIFKYLKIIED